MKFFHIWYNLNWSNRRKILAVTTQLKQLRKENLKKIQAWTGFEPMTSAMPVQCSTNWAIKPTDAIQIYVSYIYIHLFILHGYIANSPYDQLPVGLIAQLVEHCTGIAEVMGSNPVQAWNFFRLSFRSCLSCVVTARIFLLFDLSSAVQIYVSYIYIHLNWSIDQLIVLVDWLIK